MVTGTDGGVTEKEAVRIYDSCLHSILAKAGSVPWAKMYKAENRDHCPAKPHLFQG